MTVKSTAELLAEVESPFPGVAQEAIVELFKRNCKAIEVLDKRTNKGQLPIDQQVDRDGLMRKEGAEVERNRIWELLDKGLRPYHDGDRFDVTLFDVSLDSIFTSDEHTGHAWVNRRLKDLRVLIEAEIKRGQG